MTDAGRWGTRTVRWLRTAVFQSGTRGGPVPAPADRLITIPNAITMLRLLCLPVFGYLVIGRKAWLAALLLAWILAGLDVIDGYVARRFNQVSRLGVALDPLVDRLTLAAMSIILALASVIAWWLAAVILARDVILLSLLPAVLHRRMPIRVTLWGKLGSLALLFGLPGILAAKIDSPVAVALLAGSIGFTTVGTMLYYASLLQYLRRANQHGR